MSTMSRKLATVAFGALLVVSAGARAAQELPPFFQSFEGLDADANGRIGIDEAYQVQIRQFASLDGNRDGSLTRVEFIGTRSGPAEFGFGAIKLFDTHEKLFAAWDVNGDGKISQAEFFGGSLTNFARVDRNGDSSLDKAEYDARLK